MRVCSKSCERILFTSRFLVVKRESMLETAERLHYLRNYIYIYIYILNQFRIALRTRKR